MSDSAAPGPGATDALQPDNPTPAQPTPDNGSPGKTVTSWLDGLSGDNRKLAESKGWKEPGDIDKVFTSYTEMEKLRGESVRIPGADAKPEEWDAYLSKLPASMRPPESADKYEFKLPPDLPPDLPYSDDLATKSKEWMHAAGLPPDKAQAVHDGFVGYMAEQHKAAQAAQAAAVAQKVETTHDELVQEWGPQDSEGFKEKHALGDRAIKKLGLVDVFKENGILLEDGALTNPQVARALAVIGESMFREDTVDTGSGVPPGENPFKRDASGKPNLIGISSLVKNDPERAKRLAKEAGEDIRKWMSSNPR